jgi:predicted transcriptional regulator
MGLELTWENRRAGSWRLVDSDWVCIPLAKMLEKEGKLSLNEVVKKSGLARQTAHTHLKHLVEDGILIREVIKQGRGRPTILYSRTEKPICILKTENVVSLTFQKLKRACRFRNDKWCKETKGYCSSKSCPLTLK